MADVKDPKYQEFVTKAFEAADLPEVPESQLEPGTYTNAQIAEKMVRDPLRLMTLLMGIQDMGSVASKRSILSFAVDKVLQEWEEKPPD